jgi:hypothetical protein
MDRTKRIRMRKKFALVFGALIVGLTFGLTGTVASAATAYGNYGAQFGGGSGVSYWGRSGVNNTIDNALGSTISTAPTTAGRLGVRPRGFIQATGAMCVDGGWIYNNTTTSSFGAGGYHASCVGHAVYGYSISRGWDTSWGSNYAEYWNYFSPALNF